MQAALVFEETQRPRQWWLWGILVVVGFAGLASAVFGFASSAPDDQVGAAVTLVLTLLVIGAFTASFLRVRVDADTIDVLYVPFFRRRYPTRRLVRADARTVKPMREYGGWGIRRSALGNGWAYTVDGREGVQLEFDDGRRVFLGSRKPDELAAALRLARGPH